MNIYIMLAIIATNAVAIALVYQFIKRLPKIDRLVFIAGSVAIIYILVSVVYWISGLGIENDVHDAIKNFITYIFVPINVILLIPFIATKYTKLKNNDIATDDFLKRLLIMGVVTIIILVMEYNYFKGMQLNIVRTLQEKSNESNVENSILGENLTQNESTINEQIINSTVNSINDKKNIEDVNNAM